MKRVFLLLSFLCLTACGYRGIGGSFVGDLPEKAAIQAIADDAANYLAQEYAPGHTSLYVLTPEKSANNAFSASLDAALRVKGFTISENGNLSLAYTLDSLKDDEEGTAWYLQLRLSDGKAVARSYDLNGTPEAGRSLAPLEKGALLKAKEKASDAVNETYEGVTEKLL